ncbi:hypothetical protein [Argonema antarcticum]|uniref:hypothetical protein n=1 Tax=Argonema antarcticum TaxID=2942763 RepID=UPI0020131416|nr:hypothetical protein [Argonema antarcticum]MCL1471708.1 hypothetical protein [Argonema antarcticum A004/B2]
MGISSALHPINTRSHSSSPSIRIAFLIPIDPIALFPQNHLKKPIAVRQLRDRTLHAQNSRWKKLPLQRVVFGEQKTLSEWVRYAEANAPYRDRYLNLQNFLSRSLSGSCQEKAKWLTVLICGAA